MTTKNLSPLIITIAVFASALIWWRAAFVQQQASTNSYQWQVFEGNCGWGYDILVNDSLLIHQESVPVLAGNCGFAKRDWAEKAAQAIINKMKNGQAPQLTSFDLRQIADLNQLSHAAERNHP